MKDVLLAVWLLAAAASGYWLGVAHGYSDGVQANVRTWSFLSGF